MARILHAMQEKLYLGNLDGERDWGYAPEFVEGMWKMLQQDEPEGFHVIFTGPQPEFPNFLYIIPTPRLTLLARLCLHARRPRFL